MRKLLALFALAVGLIVGGVAMAQDKPAETTPAAEAPGAARKLPLRRRQRPRRTRATPPG